MDLQHFDLTSPDFKRNPFPTIAKMRQCGPLIPMRLSFIGETWVATTYEATIKILRDKERFVTNPQNAGRKHYAGMQWWMPRMIRTLTNNMLGKDEPDHRRLRGLVESAFMRQSIESMRPRIEVLADQYLDQLHHVAEQNGGLVDLTQHFSRPFPLSVISELLGFPADDRPKFLRWASSLSNINSPLGFFKFIPGLWKLRRYFERQFEACRKHPRPGMLSALVQAEQDGHQLSKDELMASTFLLLLAGHETTVHLLSGAVLTLLQHPEQKAELLADRSLGYATVGEVLRHFSSVQMTKPRYASRDMELYGQHIKRGESCVPLLAAANADPAEFPDPEQFDIHREPNRQVTFGTGMHTCLGMKLAWAEVEIALQRLFSRFPDLSLAVPEKDLKWSARVGQRALRSLPIQLGSQSSNVQRISLRPAAQSD